MRSLEDSSPVLAKPRLFQAVADDAGSEVVDMRIVLKWLNYPGPYSMGSDNLSPERERERYIYTYTYI